VQVYPGGASLCTSSKTKVIVFAYLIHLAKDRLHNVCTQKFGLTVLDKNDWPNKSPGWLNFKLSLIEDCPVLHKYCLLLQKRLHVLQAQASKSIYVGTGIQVNVFDLQFR
jgi:hypothetical protein